MKHAVGEGSEGSDKLGGHPQLINKQRQLDSDSEENTEHKSPQINLEVLFGTLVIDDGIERGQDADPDLDVVDDGQGAGAAAEGQARTSRSHDASFRTGNEAAQPLS